MNDIYDSIPDFGALYDAVPVYGTRGDVRFYAEEAAKTKGAVLEIGCGSGRVLLPAARQGSTITGLDPSREMLKRLEAKLADEPANVRTRVTLTEGDARRFDLGRTFALITAPFRVFQHMVSVEDQLAVLASVARHLAPGGRFVFDVFNPNFSVMTLDRTAESEDTPEFALPDGRRMRRAARIANVRMLDQVNEVELIYYVTPKEGGEARRYVQPFPMRWFMPNEMRHLLARAGFRVDEAWGDFDRGPLRDGCPELIWCVSRA